MAAFLVRLDSSQNDNYSHLSSSLLQNIAFCLPSLHMHMVSTIFWLSGVLLIYVYIGYGLLLWLINQCKQQQPTVASELPAVTLIVPAYQEAAQLPSKIKNCQQLIYPANKLTLLFAIDGNVDDSKNIIEQYPGVSLVYAPQRLGKMAAINNAMKHVTTPIVIFSDANTLLNPNAVLALVKHYVNPKIGGVAGEKKVSLTNSPIGHGEGLYWRYESFLKQMDSEFNTVIGAAGELFSMRTHLFEPQPTDTILDDFMLWAAICAKGYKVSYEPNAFATEKPSADLNEESKRRIRIAAGVFQSAFRLGMLLNVFKHPLLTFQYLSRRIFRWVLCPILLPVFLFTNGILAINDGGIFYMLTFMLQLLFYSFASIGGIFTLTNKKAPLAFFVPFYFVFMNVALYMGFIRYVKGSQSATWEKAIR
jgi:cellulose synthase/poly-beta-1,6-N-acetylglucosamine synthase-like glycosyltransferase